MQAMKLLIIFSCLLMFGLEGAPTGSDCCDGEQEGDEKGKLSFLNRKSSSILLKNNDELIVCEKVFKSLRFTYPEKSPYKSHFPLNESYFVVLIQLTSHVY